ncbi:unnamed protein product [Parascedosporium putredinis]|uniref:Nudix hydrolase domain-containing protein n=1 Tax=Parascedosporium putredinis TaxID=1442378 RepID=A0A9P1H760_9PEZI|nr:unnamed protein product [Parascedosporium putredinis]CAI8001092.1 unnamed protein product [Parascedosporium putredinis]
MSGAQMQLEDWLDDLCVRFIINLPQEDLSSVPRICFQVEEAQWFYEDFIRPLNPTLPSMSLRTFCLRIFQHCPLLTTFPVGAHIQAFEEFCSTRPVSRFPRGKINKDEDDLDCAIREVYEETGFDIREAGLVASQKETKFIEVTMRDQQIRLYVFRDVPMDTQFQPRTRKEISKIQWYKLSDLPAFRKKGHGSHTDAGNAANNANKFYMVAPFLVPLKKWIVQQQKSGHRARNDAYTIPDSVPEETATEDDTWAQPHDAHRGPDLDALAGATRELQRLLKMQPPTQGLQRAPSQPSPNKTRAAPSSPFSTTQPSPPPGPAPSPREPGIPSPVFSLHQQAPTHWGGTPDQYANAHPGSYPPVQYGEQQPNYLPPQPQPQPQPQPPLVHPQPLPPHVQKTGVLNYTTPSPNTRLNGPMRQGQHYGAPQQPQYPGYPTAILKPQGGPLTDHSKALLSAFKTQTSASHDAHAHVPDGHNAPPYPSSDNEMARAPDGYNIAQPYQAAPVQQQIPASMYSSHQSAPSTSSRPPGQGTEKHRSALLDMFKRADPNASPRSANFGRPASGSGSGSNSKPGSIDQPGSPGSKPYHSPRARVHEHAAPRVPSSGSSQPLMQLLRRQEQPSPKTQQPIPAPSYSAYYDPAKAVPAGLSSPPAPTTFPAPRRRWQAPSMDYRAGSMASGAGFAASAASNMHESDSRRGSQTPISPADRSFLLGYLQSATHQAGH